MTLKRSSLFATSQASKAERTACSAPIDRGKYGSGRILCDGDDKRLRSLTDGAHLR